MPSITFGAPISCCASNFPVNLAASRSPTAAGRCAGGICFCKTVLEPSAFLINNCPPVSAICGPLNVVLIACALVMEPGFAAFVAVRSASATCSVAGMVPLRLTFIWLTKALPSGVFIKLGSLRMPSSNLRWRPSDSWSPAALICRPCICDCRLAVWACATCCFRKLSM